MDIYAVRILETVEKMALVKAENVQEAQYYASEMDDDEFDFNKVVGSKSTAVMLAEDGEYEENEDDEDDESCDMSTDCHDCPEGCEACGTCSREGHYVANRGKCANCEYRCSVCYACTCDDCKELRK